VWHKFCMYPQYVKKLKRLIKNQMMDHQAVLHCQFVTMKMFRYMILIDREFGTVESCCARVYSILESLVGRFIHVKTE
jgi:hypothetical protein